MINNKKKWCNTLFVYYTLSFIIVSLIVFSCFAIYHKSFILSLDGFKQHYPLLVKLRHMCGEFFRGNGFAFWSQDIGLGGDTIGNMAIVICDPFNYVAAAFPPKFMSIGYCLAVMLRLYAAGWAMIAFLKYHSFSKRICMIGGIGYAFCCWAISVVWHAFFLNPLVFFPLLILGIDFVFDRKKPYLLVFSIWISLITYIYFAYMSAIFCLLYVVVRFCIGEHDMQRTFKDFRQLFGRLTLSVVIACMLAAPIIISMTYTILNVNKAGGMELTFFLSLKEASRYLPTLITNIDVNGNYSHMGANALFAATIPFMLIYRKKKSLKVPVGLCLFCMLMNAFPVWGSIMNGFNYSVGRWCYILAFFFVWAAVGTLVEMEKAEALNKKAFIIWLVGLAASLLVARYATGVLTPILMIIGFLNLVIMALMFWLLTHGKKQYLFALMILSIGITQCLTFFPCAGNRVNSFMGFLTPYKAYETSVLRAADAIDDSDFYRLDFTEHIKSSGYMQYVHGAPNENMYWGERTVFAFLSTIDGRLLQRNREVGNNAGYYYRVAVFSNDNRSRLNFLEGVKYYLSNVGSEKAQYAGYGYTEHATEDGVEIQKANQDVSLGYVYPRVIGEKQYEGFTPLGKEQVMMQAAVMSDEDIKKLDMHEQEIDAQEIILDIEEIPYTVSSESPIQPQGNKLESTKENQTLDITIPQCENCELYVEFRGLKRMRRPGETNDTFDYYVDYDGISKIVLYATWASQGLSDQIVFMSNLGYYAETEGDISITFTPNGEYSYDSLKVYAVSQENFDEQAENLTEQRFTMTEQTTNSIRGTVNAKQDGILYLSLLYHPGWTIYIDGQEQELLRVNTAFCGAKISQGEHEIVLTYRPIAYKISLLLCCMGILCIVGMVFVYRRRESDDKQKG